MKLDVEGGTVIEGPSASDIARELAGLSYPQKKFAILEDGARFVQVYRDPDGSFAVEHSEGSVDRMFQYQAATLAQATEVMQRFLRGDDYRSAVPFVPLKV